MPFTTIASVAINDPTRVSDWNNLISDLNYFRTATVFGINPSTNTTVTMTGQVVFTATGAITITASGQNILFDAPAFVNSIANTTALSTLTGSIIFQPGANLGITISGSTFNFTATAAGGGNTQPAFYAHLGVAMNVAAATDTKVTFDTAAFNVRGMFVTATNRGLPSVTGIYAFTTHIAHTLAAVPASESLTVRLYKNGAIFNELSRQNIGLGAACGCIDRVTAVTDFYEINVENASVITLTAGTTTNWFQGCRLGDI